MMKHILIFPINNVTYEQLLVIVFALLSAYCVISMQTA